MPKLIRTASLCLLCCFALAIPAMAMPETAWADTYCFAQEDFPADLNGIVVTAVPAADEAQICCGSRVLRAGDILPSDVLPTLILTPKGDGNTEATLTYLPVYAAGLGAETTFSIHIGSRENTAPVASDSAIETYKNVANTGTLSVTDAEDDPLVFTLVTPPKRGTVEFQEDGTYVYTPLKNKVGSDSFTYTATDPAGNVSNEATVTVEIRKPEAKTTYADMEGDPDAFAAMWLADQGLFTGETVAGRLCFCPDQTVSRGEFLVMAMELLDMDADNAQLTSGFADEASTPDWVNGYIVSALRAGVITGVASEDGMVFRADTPMTCAEAAVMLQNVLELPVQAGAFSADSVPAWAASAMNALSGAGIELTSATQPITRRECARLLYGVSTLL